MEWSFVIFIPACLVDVLPYGIQIGPKLWSLTWLCPGPSEQVLQHCSRGLAMAYPTEDLTRSLGGFSVMYRSFHLRVLGNSIRVVVRFAVTDPKVWSPCKNISIGIIKSDITSLGLIGLTTRVFYSELLLHRSAFGTQCIDSNIREWEIHI